MNYFEWVTEGLLIFIVGIIGLFGNGVSIWTFWRQRVHRIFHNLLLILAIFDMVSDWSPPSDLCKKRPRKNLSLLHISKIMPRMHCFTYLVQTQLMTFRIVCSTHRFITFPSKVLKIIILTFVPDLCGVLHPSIFLSEILAFLRSIGPNTNPTLRHTHSPNWVDGECVLHSGFGYRTVFGRLLSLFASKVSYQHQNACTLHTILTF